MAKDNHGAQTAGPVWRLTTGSQPNQDPYTPSNPNPAHLATNVSVTTNLSWTGGDPDPGDTVTYDVYFGTSSSPPLAQANNATTSWDPPGSLPFNTTHYWKIVAKDNHGAQTAGPVWRFSTRQNRAPNPPDLLSPPERTQHDVSASFTWRATDPDGDTVKVCVDWKGGNPRQECSTLRSSGSQHTISHSWPDSGYYDIEYWAEDEHGATSSRRTYQDFKVWTWWENSGRKPNDYTYIVRELPNSNFCHKDILLAGVYNGAVYRALFKWNLTSFAGYGKQDVDVDYAYVDLDASQVLGTGATFQMRDVANAWSCSSVTWSNNRPGIGSRFWEFSAPVTASLNVRGLFEDQLRGDLSNHGFYFKIKNEGQSGIHQAWLTVSSDIKLRYRYRYPY